MSLERWTGSDYGHRQGVDAFRRRQEASDVSMCEHENGLDEAESVVMAVSKAGAKAACNTSQPENDAASPESPGQRVPADGQQGVGRLQ